MNCVVDGRPFDFMDVSDISSIFGNALDNAIECEEKIVEKEKSLIATVHKYHGEVDISQEDNWFILKILIPNVSA